MTREEAKRRIEICRDFLANNYSDMGEPNFTAFNMAIQALSQEPCDVFDEYGNYKYPNDVELVEPNMATSMPCDDAISRDAVLLYIDEVKKGERVNFGTLLDMARYYRSLPSVTQKSGKWKREEFPNFTVAWFCNKCGRGSYHKSNFCPNCGACMKDGRTLDEFIEDSKESEDKE